MKRINLTLKLYHWSIGKVRDTPWTGYEVCPGLAACRIPRWQWPDVGYHKGRFVPSTVWQLVHIGSGSTLAEDWSNRFPSLRKAARAATHLAELADWTKTADELHHNRCDLYKRMIETLRVND